MYCLLMIGAMLPFAEGQMTSSSFSNCAYTFIVPKINGETQCSSGGNDKAHEDRISILESVIKNQQQQLGNQQQQLAALTQTLSNFMTAKTSDEISGSETLGFNGSVNYVRYGHKSCRDKAKLIYDGYVGKCHYTHGGGVNYLCLPKDPEWPNAQAGSQSGAHIYGVEYESSIPSIHENDVPCAVCEVSGKSQKIMIPGKKTCMDSWTLEYSGLLMSDHKDHKGSDFACVDSAMQPLSGGSQNENGGLFYLVTAVCGSLPCPPYVNGNVLSCVVCTK